MKGLLFFNLLLLNIVSYSQEIEITDTTISVWIKDEVNMKVTFDEKIFKFNEAVEKSLKIAESKTYYFNILINENGNRVDLLHFIAGGEKISCIENELMRIELIILLNSVSIEILECKFEQFNYVLPIKFQ